MKRPFLQRRIPATFLATDAMKGVEDGFSYLLTKQDFERVQAALASGQPLTLPGTNGMPALVIQMAR